MTGRLADLLHFAWALVYWNSRKSWYRLRHAQTRCPCQHPSDSGRALETGCDAAVTWHRPERFRRVCPLLVRTPHGLRCSVDARDVRPFWIRAAAYGGTAAVTLYFAGVLTVFVALRSIGYPVSVPHLAWPGSWHRVTEARGWYFAARANRAFAAGRGAEGLLYLTNAFDFDPGNYALGLSLARKLELTQSSHADVVYRRLLHGHPENHTATAQLWFRSLLARGNFLLIEQLARDEVIADRANAGVWMRALIFATRRTGHTAPLESLRSSKDPGAAPWQTVIDCELHRHAGQSDAVRQLLNRRWDDAPPYAWFYQVHSLTELGDGYGALDRLASYDARLDNTARIILQLDAFASMGATASLERTATKILAAGTNSPAYALLAAQLIRHPDPAILDQVYTRFMNARVPLDGESLEIYLALYAAASVAHDWPKAQALSSAVDQAAGGPVATLGIASAFFHGDAPQTRIAGLLIAMPMPLEVHYALLERYSGAPTRTLTAGQP